MRQRLNKGTKANPEKRRIVIQLFYFLAAEPSPHITEVRLSFHLYRVFQIQTDKTVAEICRDTNQSFHRVCAKYGIPGKVKHHAEFRKRTVLHNIFLLSGCKRKNI